ncbi:MAG: hypothetical protein LUC93_09655 [Planctomycetaceae bacterium]|nr:hypothetical protein [Planctomycetaceae bacterium]
MNAKQMMAVAIARHIENHKTYIIGTGLPLIGATLAKNTHAPDTNLIFETALFEGSPQEVPTSVSDLRNCYHASVLWPQYRYFGFQALSMRSGAIDCGFLGGAQIDPYGNLNATSIGDYWKPETRFTGSGGANGIATHCDTIIVMKHEKRRFCEKVDYVTSPGWLDGKDGRAKAGLPPDKGPRAVVTELGVLRFDEGRRMYLAEVFPGATVQEIQENTGFELDVSHAVEAEVPSEAVLSILRDKVDPLRLMI